MGLFFLGLFIGVVVGGIIGICMTALVSVNKSNSDDEQIAYLKKLKEKQN